MSNTPNARRHFLRTGFAGFFVALFAGLPRKAFADEQSQKDGVVVQEQEGVRIIMGRSKAEMNIKISKSQHGIDSVSFCMEDVVPGRKLPVHKHLDNDEVIFIHKGAGRFTLGEKTIEVKTGAVVFVPRGVWHGLENTGEENLTMVIQYAPAGFEQYFVENGTPVGMPSKVRTPEEYAATEKKYGMVYKIPR